MGGGSVSVSVGGVGAPGSVLARWPRPAASSSTSTRPGTPEAGPRGKVTGVADSGRALRSMEGSYVRGHADGVVAGGSGTEGRHSSGLSRRSSPMPPGEPGAPAPSHCSSTSRAAASCSHRPGSCCPPPGTVTRARPSNGRSRGSMRQETPCSAPRSALRAQCAHTPTKYLVLGRSRPRDVAKETTSHLTGSFWAQ